MLSSLVDKSNKIFQSLSKKKYISEKEMKYFTYNNKNAANIGKLYFLPKIHKLLFNISGRPVISNCGTPTEKVLENLDFSLKPIMQNGWSYVKDSSDFKNKIKKLGKLSGNITLVTADVVSLYPSIPHEDGLETLRETLVKSEDLKLPVNDIVLKWENLFSRITYLSLVGKLSSTLREKQLVLNLLSLMHVFTWMR